jgi:cytoskeletal protein CcmA (bactofilin family)
MSKNNQPAVEAPNISLIGTGTVITGEITGKGDIRIDGILKGKLHTEGKLVLGNTGRIEGEVKANSADISGKVFGKMEISDLLAIKSNSQIEGDIKIGKISIEQGAIFTGTCIMGNTNTTGHFAQTNATEQEQ